MSPCGKSIKSGCAHCARWNLPYWRHQKLLTEVLSETVLLYRFQLFLPSTLNLKHCISTLITGFSAGQVMTLLARHDTISSCRSLSLPPSGLMNANGKCRACTLQWGQIMAVVVAVVGAGVWVQWRVTVKLVNRFILPKEPSYVLILWTTWQFVTLVFPFSSGLICSVNNKMEHNGSTVIWRSVGGPLTQQVSLSAYPP